MSEPVELPPNPTLIDLVQAEQQSVTSAAACGAVQDGAPDNVCLREPGHVGPHVAKPADEFLQWED